MRFLSTQEGSAQGEVCLAAGGHNYGGEPAFDGDKVIGVTTSGSYGHTVGKSLAFVYVSPEYAVPETTFDIEILSNRRQAKVLAEPAYDPKNKRLRA